MVSTTVSFRRANPINKPGSRRIWGQHPPQSPVRVPNPGDYDLSNEGSNEATKSWVGPQCFFFGVCVCVLEWV